MNKDTEVGKGGSSLARAWERTGRLGRQPEAAGLGSGHPSASSRPGRVALGLLQRDRPGNYLWC